MNSSQSPPLKTIIIEICYDCLRVGRAEDACPLFSIPCSLPLTHPPAQPQGLLIQLSGLLSGIFLERLHISPKKCKVILVEPMLCCASVRNALFTVLLSTLQVGAVSFQPDLPLAALGSGCSSALMVSVGVDESTALVVAHGRVLLGSLTTSKGGIGGLVEQLNTLLGGRLGLKDGVNVLQELRSSGRVLPRQGLPAGGQLDASQVTTLYQSLLEDIVEMLTVMMRALNADTRPLVQPNLLVVGLLASVGLAEAICSHSQGQFATPRTANNPAWLGAAVFAHTASSSKFITLEEAQDWKDAAAGGEGGLTAPDWMSASRKMWRFFGPDTAEYQPEME